MFKALTIAGSDSGGGAGIQADLKTFTAYGVYGTSVITAITAQNTLGVAGIEELSIDIIEKQLEAVITDIGTDAVKTGMLANPEVVSLVAETVEKHCLFNLVVDPVMIAKSGDSLLSEQAVATIKEKLIPLATIITPNIPEAEKLLGWTIENEEAMKEAAKELYKLGSRIVVVKGGHLADFNRDINPPEIPDIIYDGYQIHEVRKEYICSYSTHGTGCTFASAIAAGLAKGYTPIEAIRTAKRFITEAIRTAPQIGTGHGPVNHQIGLITRW